MRHLLLTLSSILLLASAGCLTISPPATPAPVSPPAQFSASGSDSLPSKWWTVYGDETLNSWMDEAMGANQSLQVIRQRLAVARAVAMGAGSDGQILLDGTASAGRRFSRTKSVDSTETSSLTLGLAASWEADLWGRIGAGIEASELAAIAAESDLSAAALSLSGEIVDTWIQLIEGQAELQILAVQIKTNEDFYKVLKARFGYGQTDATDVLQQEQLLESTQGERIQVEARQHTLMHQLAVLLGRQPTDLLSIRDELPTLPPLPATGIPAEWAQARPDLEAQWLRVMASSSSVVVAEADRLPRLSIGLSASTTTTELRDLLDNWAATLAANLAAPLLDGGRRKAEVARTEAVLQRELHVYGDLLLAALLEVENGLSALDDQQRYVDSLLRQEALSEKATEQVRRSYAQGQGDFTRYLTTRTAHQRLTRNRLSGQASLLRAYTGLARALGGGWELTTTDVQDKDNADE